MKPPLVQLRLPWDEPAGRRAVPAAEHTVTIDGCVFPVAIARHRRARRYVLRLTVDGTLRLTVPRGASIAGGLRFAGRQGAWIGRERARQKLRAEPWGDGTVFWWRGRREVLRVSGNLALFAGEEAPIDPAAGVRASIDAHGRAFAERTLPARCLELAGVHELTVARVSVRNQRSRWGACSARRVITLNWRLVQMPPSVADYVILHELMHLRQANHSRRFWREVERVCASWRESEAWLRRHGREIL